jgi:hypothetical protein
MVGINMNKKIAVLSDNVVINVIIAQSAEEASALTGRTCVESQNAAVGYIFDEEKGIVIPLQPFESWELNEEQTGWVAPTEMPDDGAEYHWDEDKLEWVETVQVAEVEEAAIEE